LKNFRDIVDAICREAGWSRPKGDDPERLAVDLEGGLSFEALALSSRRLLFKARLAERPDSEDDIDRIGRRLGLMSAASFQKRRSILSLNADGFYLHLIADLNLASETEIAGLCRDFLNDCQWWRKNFPDQAPLASFSEWPKLPLSGGF
jgi:hypothetical protein